MNGNTVNITIEDLEKIALNAIYNVDYDIGKECDPAIYEDDADTNLIEEVAHGIKIDLIKLGLEIEE